MNEYSYIDTAGKQQKVTASNPNDATRLAPNIAKNSGVMLVTPTTTNTSEPMPAASLKPPTTPDLPTPTAPAVQEQYVTGLTDNVAQARTALDTTYKTQKEEADKKIAELDKQRAEILGKAEPLTDPFRADLEAAQRDKLHINENFEKNQKLTNELDTLLTEGNNLIKYNQGLPVSQRVVASRSDKAISDVAARAGVIQAVMAARNSQIGVAENMIDRSVAAITADRTDKLNYYDTLLKLNDEDKLSLSAESKKIAEEQRNLMKSDLDSAQTSADYIKSLMISPEHAQLVADAGITLNDSVEQINTKLAAATKQQEIVDLTNDLTSKGYKAALVSGPGTVEFEAGGKKLYFTPPPDKTKVAGPGPGKGGSLYTEKNLPGDVRTSIIEDLTDAAYAQKNGALTLDKLATLYPEVEMETLRSLYDEFYDYDTLVAGTDAEKKPWWKFW